jgi:hypothetical protein
MRAVLEGLGTAGLLGAVAAYWVTAIRGAARHEHAVLKEHARANRAHYAAVEAAEDDPAFSPDAIEHYVVEVVALAGRFWQTGKFDALDDRADADLVRAWARSRQSSLGSGLSTKGKPSVD